MAAVLATKKIKQKKLKPKQRKYIYLLRYTTLIVLFNFNCLTQESFKLRLEECEEGKSDCLLYFTYLLSLSENIEIQRRDICFSSFCISELQVTVPIR